MPAAPPAADTKKPATPPPAKAGAEGDKAKGGDAKAAGGDSGAEKKTSAPSAAQDKKAPAAGAGGTKAGAAGGGDKAGAAGGQQRFDRMAVRAKLAVSEPGDAVEREADAIADKVMRMPADPKAGADPGSSPPAAKQDAKEKVTRAADPGRQGGGAGAAGSAPAQGGKNEAGQAKKPSPVAPGTQKPLSTGGTKGGAATEQRTEQTPQVQRKEAEKDNAGRLTVPADFASNLGEGEPMDAPTRAFFENRFGRDLSQVRIHTDANAQRAAVELRARAFTFGRHIAFAAGEYQPNSDVGKRLLSHELAHYVQHSDQTVSRQIMRQSTTTSPPAAGSEEIAVKSVKIPAFKKDYYSGTYKRAANYRRSAVGSKQTSIWKKATSAVPAAFQKDFGLAPDGVYAAIPKKVPLSPTAPELLVGAPSAMSELVCRPKWKTDGTANPHDIDHKVELQIGGPSFDREDNLELRDSKANQDSGRNIDDSITAQLKLAKDKEGGDPEKIRASSLYTLAFSDFAGGGGATDSSRYALKDINELKGADGLNVFDPDKKPGAVGKSLPWPGEVDKKPFFGSPDLLVLYPSRRGGTAQQLPLTSDRKKLAPGASVPTTWIPGFELSKFDFNAPTGQDLGSITMALKVDGFPGGYPPQTVNIRRLSNRPGDNVGFISTEGVRNKISTLLNKMTPVPQSSPVKINEDDIDILPGSGLTITGIVEPGLPILKGATIDFEVTGRSFQLSKTFTADEMKLPGPFKVTSSSITIAINSSSGFSVTGVMNFAITGLGEGALKGVGKTNSFGIGGEFIFNRKLFDGQAVLKATYVKESETSGRFKGEADLEIGKKIKGIKGAKIHASIDNETFQAKGTAKTEVPGLKEVDVGITIKDAENFSVSGKGNFEKFPGIKSGSLTLTLARKGDDWQLEGAGEAEPDLPLKDASIKVDYKNGIFKGEVTAQFDYRDIFKGGVKVGVTNGPVSASGKPQGSTEGGKTLTIYGEGNVKAKLGEKLQGGVDVEVRPTGDLIVNGDVGIAKAITVFERYPESKKPIELVSVPTVSIPLIGLAVGGKTVGIALEIGGGVTGYAYVGPGQLTAASIGVKEFNPKRPESLHAVGHAMFEVPAAAGVDAKINAGVAAGLAVIKAEAKLEASAGAEVATEPGTGASLDLDWTPTTGLALKANLNATLGAKLKLSLTGYAQVIADAFVRKFELWRKDWVIAQKEFGSDLKLGINVPVAYSTLTNKIDFDPAKIKYTVPKLDRSVFDQVLNKEGTDQAKLPPPNPEDPPGGVCEMPGDHTPKASVMPPQQSRMPPQSSSSSQVNRKEDPSGDQATPFAVDEDLTKRLGPGAPLDLATRGFFEQRLNTDLSGVRIHTGPSAARAAKKLSAKAFTVGEQIAFAEGEYQPATPQGRELLAHELTHVLQQKDAAKPAVNRRIDPTPAARHKPGSDTPTALANLEKLQIPAVKARHLPLYSSLTAAGNLKRVKGYERRGADQRSVWLSSVQVSPTEVGSRLTERGIAVPGNPRDKVAITLGGRNYKKTVGELQTMLRIPEWGRHGKRPANGFQVDHIVELQVSGQHGTGVGNSIENMELLDQPSNSSSGGTIRGGIYTRVDAYLASLKPAPDRGAFLRRTDIVFESVQASSAAGAPAGNSAWWSKADIENAEPLHTAQPAPPTRDGAPNAFILSSAPGGIEVGRFPHDPAASVITPQGAARRRLAGMEIQSITLANAGTGSDATVGTIQATWDLPKDWRPADPNVTLQLAADGDYRGYPARIPTPALEFQHLSPVRIDSVSAEDGQIQAQGQLAPSLNIFKTPINVAVSGREATFSIDYGAGDLALPVPGVSIDDSSVRVFYSTARGFGVGGQIFFSVERVGSGDLSASFSTGGGVALEGRFNFDRSLFDRAQVRAWWRNGEMGAEGEIGIDQPDKIRGIRNANLSVGISNRDWFFRGNAALTVPGVSDASIGARKTDAGLLIDGDVNLSSSALVRSGRIHVTAEERAEGWKLAASGSALPNIPGVESELQVAYDDGAFTASFSGSYARGMMSGNVTVGVTNRSVDEQGNIGGLADPDAPLVVYGSGQATLRIAPWLQGTAGIKFAPNGEVTVSGEIALPGQVSLFERREINKSLFSLSTQIPVFPGIVAEVGGSLSAKAGIGPGVLDQCRIHVDYSPAHEENTHVTGDAHLKVPADAGLRLAARAGIGLGITGASATGGLELGGTLGIDGAAEASVHVDWMPRQGLSIDAEASFHAEPKFKFDVSGYIAVTALGFSVYDQRWQLASLELGSNLRFGVAFPLHYREGEPFSVSLDDVRFDVPDVDPSALIGQLGRQIF